MSGFRSPLARELYQKLTAASVIVPPSLRQRLDRVTILVSSVCNLRCNYCFALRRDYGTDVPNGMTSAKATAVVRSILAAYEDIAQVTFFGGEPLLQPDVIQSVCDLVRSTHASRGRPEPRFHVNTNIAILSDRIVDLIRRNGLQLTASVDGPSAVHDANRKFIDGTGSFSAVDQHISRCRELTGQPSALEVVYTPEHLEAGWTLADLYCWLEKRYGGVRLLLHPVFVEDVRKTQLCPLDVWDAYERTMYGLAFDYGLLRLKQAFERRDLSALRDCLEGFVAASYTDSFCECGVNSLAVATDGSVYPCGVLAGRAEFLMAQNCTVESLQSRQFIDAQRISLNNRKSNHPVCGTCDIWKTCQVCAGALLVQNGHNRGVVATFCQFNIGLAEGMLIGLDQAMKGEWPWDDAGWLELMPGRASLDRA